jgi:hypothetical protein
LREEAWWRVSKLMGEGVEGKVEGEEEESELEVGRCA